jgi:hypothetical protein
VQMAPFPRVATINAQCLSPAKQVTALAGDTGALKHAAIETTKSPIYLGTLAWTRVMIMTVMATRFERLLLRDMTICSP